MIIKIKQTESNTKQEYEIETDGGYYYASAGRFFKQQPITLKSRERELIARWRMASPLNYVPLLHLLGYDRQTKLFTVGNNGENVGSFCFSRHGFLKSYYKIKAGDGTELLGYDIGGWDFNYMCIFKDGVQIALLETYLTVTDYKYNLKLYLLDVAERYAEELMLFSVYYASYRFSVRFHMTWEKTMTGREKIYSKYKHLYDEGWRETHFPDENFFGKLNKFE